MCIRDRDNPPLRSPEQSSPAGERLSRLPGVGSSTPRALVLANDLGPLFRPGVLATHAVQSIYARTPHLGLFAVDVNAAKQAEERGQRELSRF